MAILLFSVCFIFSLIFYIFLINKNSEITLYSSESLSGNLSIEALFFLIIGFIFLFYFSNFSSGSKKKSEISGFNFKLFKEYLNIFLQKHLYYIGFIFFYTGVFFVFRSLGISDFGYFIFFVNLVISILFFITKKLFIFRDFIKINTILFSLYYIFHFIIFFLIQSNVFSQIDIINSVLIFLFFLISIFFDKKILKKKSSDIGLVSYLFLYTFLFSSFYLNQFLENIYFVFTLNLFCLSLFIFFFIIKFSFFKNSSLHLKYIGIVFNYLSILFSIYFTLFYSFNTTIFFILVYSMFFNFFLHRNFENYVSLFFSCSIFIFINYYLFFNYIFFDEIKEIIFLAFSLSLCFCLIMISYISKLKYFYENYFYHIFSYILNLSSVIYFFFISEFDIFIFGIILLLESIFVFLSYLKLKSIKNNSTLYLEDS